MNVLMIMNSADFLGKIGSAVREFYDHDSILTMLNTERPIAHRVAFYLDPLFEDWDVDCEYNRYGKEKIKELEKIRECDPSGRPIEYTRI